MAEILFTEFSDNVATSSDGNFTVTGDGVFDNMMEAITAHIDAQYQLSRITGADYATVYLGALQTGISESLKFVLQSQAADKQADLYARQIAGFDDDAKHKLLKLLSEQWGVAFSVAQNDLAIPDSLNQRNLETVAKDLLDGLNVVNDITIA